MLENAGLFEIEIYIQRRRDTVFNFVKNREIYRECLELETDVDNSEGGSSRHAHPAGRYGISRDAGYFCFAQQKIAGYRDKIPHFPGYPAKISRLSCEFVELN